MLFRTARAAMPRLSLRPPRALRPQRLIYLPTGASTTTPTIIDFRGRCWPSGSTARQISLVPQPGGVGRGG